MSRRLRIAITFGNGPPHFFEQEFSAETMDDEADALQVAVRAFSNAFNGRLRKLRRDRARRLELLAQGAKTECTVSASK
ncbi:MAG: hypothetical protein QOF02_3175 [Blastocatellia bacterium]|nr:hypothetical protein [Blastocatellia bacterium]